MASALIGAQAMAHVTLEEPLAGSSTPYRALLRVGHGCNGSATTALSVTIPAGFRGAQPVVKAGWTVSVRQGPLAEPYEMHGKRYTEGVQEITWTARGAENALPDAFADEFVFRGTTPAKAATLWFKVVQTCEKGSNPWVEIPAANQDAHKLQFPAARLDVIDVQSGQKHTH